MIDDVLSDMIMYDVLLELIKGNEVSKMADLICHADRDAHSLADGILNSVVQEMVRETASVQLQLSFHQRRTRSLVEQRAKQDRFNKAQQKLLVFDRLKEKRQQASEEIKDFYN